MDLPNLLNKIKSRPAASASYCAIEISPSAVKTAIWHIGRQHTVIDTVGPIQAWTTDDTADLISAISTSLTPAIKTLDPQPSQVIFGLPETWVSQTSIAQHKKPILKDICAHLHLKPVGFVVTTEALINFLRETEGGPPSAILIKVEPDQVIVNLLRLGELEGAQVVGRSGFICADVEEGLARFPKTDDIPSRMIIYDSKENIEELKQELIAYDWQAKLPFLHFPKIESLSSDTSIKAIAIAGGLEISQMPKTDSTIDTPPDIVPDAPPASDSPPLISDSEPASADVDNADLSEINDETTQDTTDDDTPPPDLASEFGFTTFEVSTASKPVSTPTPTDSQTPIPPKTPETLTPPPPTMALSDPFEPELIPASLKPAESPTQMSLSSVQPSILARLLNRFKRLRFKPKIKTPVIQSRSLRRLKFPPLLIMGLVLLIFISVGGFAAYWYLPKATVTIYVKSQELSQELNFVLSTQATEPDFTTNTIPAVIEPIEVGGTKQLPTTGTKIIGERATGKVAVYNRTTSPKTFPAGTTIKSGNYKLTFDAEVRIASASSTENPDFSLTVQPSKAEAAVTAIDIGSQYNLRVDTQFSVANYGSDSFLAKAVTDFIGGSSQEVQAVSSKDVDNLKDSLIQELRSQINNQISAKSNGQQAAVFANDYQVKDQTFSAKVGEQANQLSLTMTASQNAYVYQLQHISLLAQQSLLSTLPQDFLLQAERTRVDVLKSATTADGTVTVTAKTTLYLTPIYDLQQIARNIKGKYPPSTEAYFKTLPNFVRTETHHQPPLPARINTFPRLPENITIELKTISN